MLTGKQQHGSGKTKFNREKKSGESWVKLRDEAIKKGTWVRGKDQGERRNRKDNEG